MLRAHRHEAVVSDRSSRQSFLRLGSRLGALLLATLLVACGTRSSEPSDTATAPASQAHSEVAALIAAMRENQSHPERVLELGRKALELLASDPDDASEADVLSQLSFAHQRLGNLEAAIEHGRRARDLAERAGALEQLAHASNSLAMAYQDLGKYPKAIVFVEDAVETYEELGDRRGVMTALNTKAVIHAKQGDYHAALEAWVRALDMPEVSTLPRARHVFLLNIGNMYLNLDELDQALESYSEALNDARKLGDQGDIADLLHNMGTVYTELGEHEQASRLFAEALELLQATGNQRKLGSLYVSMGQGYERQGQSRDALDHYGRAVELAELTGDRLQLVRSLLNSGRVHLLEKDAKQSLEAAGRALAVAEEMGMKVEMRDAYALLSEIHESLGEPGRALEYHKLFKATHDQIFSAESSAKIAETLTRYETREKEREIDLLRSEAAIAELEVARQVTLRNALLTGFVLLFGILFLLTNRHRLKKEAERLREIEKLKAEEVKILRGLLPICCVCKKIRDDEGYWSHLEEYLSAHSEVVLSHGICPQCFEDRYHMTPDS